MNNRWWEENVPSNLQFQFGWTPAKRPHNLDGQSRVRAGFKRRKMHFRLSCTSCLLDMECGEGLVWPLNLSAGGKTHKKTSLAKSLWRAQSTKRAGRAALADPGSPTFHVVLLTTQCFPSFLIYLPILLISNQTVSHKTWRIEIWPIHQKSNCKILLPSLLSFN